MRCLGRLAYLAAVAALLSGCTSGSNVEPSCSRNDSEIFVLEAQAVPSSTQLPCVASLPAGWTYDGFQISDGFARFWLDSDRAGVRAVEVDLRAGCDVSQAVEVPPGPDELGARTYELPTSIEPRLTGSRSIVFPGGCITYRYAFSAGSAATLILEADEALSMVPRQPIVDRVRRDLGLTLCGAGAPPCAG